MIASRSARLSEDIGDQAVQTPPRQTGEVVSIEGDDDRDIELSIVMPCLDEAKTQGTCIEKAKAFIEAHAIIGEIVIADNGSTDGSQQIARAAGARVVPVPIRGYGAALMEGIRSARGPM